MEIGGLLKQMQVTVAPAPEMSDFVAKMAADRLWGELEDLLKSTTKRVIPCEPGPYPKLCANCGGAEVVMVYEIHEGPLQFPRGKCKWLDYPAPGWYLGEVRSTACPVCQHGRMREYLERRCGLSGADLHVTLEGFHTGGDLLSGKQKALNAARACLAMNKAPAGFLTYIGDYGVGKSHLLKALVNGFRAIGILATYHTLPDLLADIQARFGQQAGPQEVIEFYKSTRVLCLDEIDKVQLTDWSKVVIFRLLNARHTESVEMLTVMASNKRPEDFPAELGYLASRITAGVVVDVPGPDMRPAQGVLARQTMAAALKNSPSAPA